MNWHFPMQNHFVGKSPISTNSHLLSETSTETRVLKLLSSDGDFLVLPTKLVLPTNSKKTKAHSLYDQSLQSCFAADLWGCGQQNHSFNTLHSVLILHTFESPLYTELALPLSQQEVVFSYFPCLCGAVTSCGA